MSSPASQLGEMLLAGFGIGALHHRNHSGWYVNKFIQLRFKDSASDLNVRQRSSAHTVAHA
jgi:hypothetical protein